MFLLNWLSNAAPRALCCATSQSQPTAHINWAIWMRGNVATSRFTRIGTSINAFLGWLKQCKCAAHGHIYTRFSFSFHVKIQIQWGWRKACNEMPQEDVRNPPEPPRNTNQSQGAEHYRQYSTENTAEDFYDHLWQSTAQQDHGQTEGLEGNQWDCNTKRGEITGL